MPVLFSNKKSKINDVPRAAIFYVNQRPYLVFVACFNYSAARYTTLRYVTLCCILCSRVPVPGSGLELESRVTSVRTSVFCVIYAN